MQAPHEHMILEEPVRLASVLTSSKPKFVTSLTKIVATIGPKSRSVETLEQCLNSGMSVARFDFSWMDAEYHQESLENLKKAEKNVGKLCAVMLDTVGPEVKVQNTIGEPVELTDGNHVVLTTDLSKVPSAQILPISYSGLAKDVKNGDTIFLGQYLFTGSETTSVWLEVVDASAADVKCLVKNSATLVGSIFTLHAAQVHISLPSLTETDKQVISKWGLQNHADIISLSYTRHAEDVKELRAFLKSHGLQTTLIYAKVENAEGLEHFDEILNEADGIILSRGNLGIDIPPEDVFLFQKSAIQRCNFAGKPVMITRVVDSMIDNLRPTRAEATDVANAVLDGSDGILLGAETLRGPYPVDAIRTVSRICGEAENVYNQPVQFQKIVKHVGEPMAYEDSVASSAVRAAIKVKAAAIIVFTSSGKSARLMAKYRPSMPVLAVVFPSSDKDSSEYETNGVIQARQCLAVRGVYPFIWTPSEANKGIPKEESGLKLALQYARSVGIMKPYDRVVIFQRIDDSLVIKIIEFEES